MSEATKIRRERESRSHENPGSDRQRQRKANGSGFIAALQQLQLSFLLLFSANILHLMIRWQLIMRLNYPRRAAAICLVQTMWAEMCCQEFCTVRAIPLY